jgi:hypothetical protein
MYMLPLLDDAKVDEGGRDALIDALKVVNHARADEILEQFDVLVLS